MRHDRSPSRTALPRLPCQSIRPPAEHEAGDVLRRRPRRQMPAGASRPEQWRSSLKSPSLARQHDRSILTALARSISTVIAPSPAGSLSRRRRAAAASAGTEWQRGARPRAPPPTASATDRSGQTMSSDAFTGRHYFAAPRRSERHARGDRPSHAAASRSGTACSAESGGRARCDARRSTLPERSVTAAIIAGRSGSIYARPADSSSAGSAGLPVSWKS